MVIHKIPQPISNSDNPNKCHTCHTKRKQEPNKAKAKETNHSPCQRRQNSRITKPSLTCTSTRSPIIHRVANNKASLKRVSVSVSALFVSLICNKFLIFLKIQLQSFVTTRSGPMTGVRGGPSVEARPVSHKPQ